MRTSTWRFALGRGRPGLLLHSRRRRRWDSRWPLAAALVLSFIVPPAVLAGEPGAVGDLYVLTPDEVRQYDGQTYEFVDSFVVDASVTEFKFGLRFGGAQDNSLFVSSRFYDPSCPCSTYWIREYDAATGQFVRIFADVSPLVSLSTLLFAENGNLLALFYEDVLQEFDLLTGGLLSDVATRIPVPVQGIIGPNRNLFVVSWDDECIVEYDLDTHAVVGPIVEGLSTPIGMTFGPNSNLFVAHPPPAGGTEQRICEYDGSTGAFVRVVVPEGSSTPSLDDCRYLRFGPNGNLFAQSVIDGGARRVLEYDPATGNLVAVLVSDIVAGVQAFTWKPEMTPTYPAPQIVGFASDPAGNCDGLPLTATVAGTGLVPGAALRLTMPGQPDIAVTPTPTGFDPDTSITVEFVPGGTAPGWWDLELTYPDAQSDVLAGAVEIIDETPCSPPVVSGFAPPTADNCSVLRDAVISGDGFFPDTTVTLVRAGQPDVAGDITDQTLTSITADFQLTHADPGLWDLVVTRDALGDGASLADALDVQDVNCRIGAVGDLYVCNTGHGNILQFDGMTGEFVCIFAERPAELVGADFNPMDLAWAPNGNLWVTSRGGSGGSSPDCVVEYDGQTGEFLGYIVGPVSGTPGAPAVCLTFGGPDGNMYLPEHTDVIGDEIYEYDRLTHENLGVVCSPSPPMHTPRRARFTSNGNFLVGGQTSGSPVPTIREYDPSTRPFTFLRDFAVEAGTRRYGFLETADGCCYLVSDLSGQRVDKFDISTAEFLGEFIPRSPCLDMGPWLPDCDQADPCFWEAMEAPNDMAYGPNGHLYVCAHSTASELAESWHQFGLCHFSSGAVHEFDPVTGGQIQVIGKQGISEWPYLATDLQRLYNPEAIEFKPMPGDWGSSASAFGGDWQVDLNDFARFAAALDGTAPSWTTAANLQSFDFDRDNDIDLADFAAFQRAFGTTMQMQTSTGACCNPDGTCTDDVWAPECGGGAIYEGDGTTCATSVCPPTGACCLPEGSCAELTSNGCDYEAGVYQGDYTDCGGVICPFGACCFASGECGETLAIDCVGTYQGDETTCASVTCPEPCGEPFVCDFDEGEPWCNYPDEFNGGCHSDPPVFSSITCDTTVCGTAWAEDGSRDTDRYELVLTESTIVDWTATAEFDLVIGLVETDPPGSGDCADTTGYINPYALGAPCETIGGPFPSALTPGTYWLFVGPNAFDSFSCATGPWEYTATLTCTPASGRTAAPPPGDAWQTARSPAAETRDSRSP